MMRLRGSDPLAGAHNFMHALLGESKLVVSPDGDLFSIREFLAKLIVETIPAYANNRSPSLGLFGRRLTRLQKQYH